MGYYDEYYGNNKEKNENCCIKDYGNGDRDWQYSKGTKGNWGRYEYKGEFYRTKQERDIAHYTDHI